MRKIIYGLVAGVLFAFTGIAFADYTIKDGAGSTQTVLAFVCATTKICPAHVLIKSDGTEIGTTTDPVQVGAPASAFADGADVTQGAKADSACGTDTGTCSQIALIKRLLQGQTTLNSNVTASVPSGTSRIGYTSDDPCTSKTKLNKPFTTNGTSSVELVALSGSTTIYVCSLAFIVSSASKVAFTTGTGTACATSNAAVIGSTTANIANSMSFAANGGLTLGGGHGTIAKGAASSALCMVNSVDQYTSGNLTYVQE